MDTPEKHQCQTTVYPSGMYGAFHGHPCSARATVLHEGKLYCRTHDPEAVELRRDKADAKWKAKSEKSKAEFRAMRSAPALARAIQLILALDGQPPVKNEMGDAGVSVVEEFLVRLDPKAREQLEKALKDYGGY